MAKTYICRFTRDGRALLDCNGVITYTNGSPVTDSPEFISGSEYLELYPPKHNAPLWTKEASILEDHNNKHIHRP